MSRTTPPEALAVFALKPAVSQSSNQDVVLYAVPGLLDDGDRNLLKQWREQGTTVIAFSSSAGIFDQNFPVDTVANIIELWTWTGEFVAACIRLGRMPVLYQSLH